MIRCALASRWRGGCRPSFPLQAAPPSEQGFDRDRPVPNLGRRPISPCFARLVQSKTPARWAAVCKAFAPRLLGSQTRVAAIANNSFIPYFIPIHVFDVDFHQLLFNKRLLSTSSCPPGSCATAGSSFTSQEERASLSPNQMSPTAPRKSRQRLTGPVIKVIMQYLNKH